MSEAQRILQQKPNLRPAMMQEWVDLAFLHWEVDPNWVASLLPDGLEPDLFEGKAHLGVVLFEMRNVRPVWAPALPWIGFFPESNVRVYCRCQGRPGVWFVSLDAARWLACAGARIGFGLPYHHASMQVRREKESIRYASCRSGLNPLLPPMPCLRAADSDVDASIWPMEEPAPAEPGSLDFFLVERYLLFAQRRGQVVSGRVWHEPYRVAKAAAEVRSCGIAAGLLPGLGPPSLAHWSPGVQVEVYSPERI